MGISLLGLIGAASAMRGAGAAPASSQPSEGMLLRLHDLQPGYIIFTLGSEGRSVPDIQCDSLRPGNAQPEVAAFVDQYSPEGCFGLYGRLFRVPGREPAAPLIGTGALDAGSAAAADAGFAVAPELLSHITYDEIPEEVAAPETIGDATRLFHWNHVPPITSRSANGRFGSFLVWRSGNVLATVFVAGRSLAADDRIAVELARRQQAHVEHPTLYTAAERYDLEVGLDDPALKVPVYWLGRNFKPGGSLPASHFEGGGAASKPPNGLPRQALSLYYSGGLHLDSWTSEGWTRFLKTAPSRKLRTWHCTESSSLDLPHGRATVFAGYRRDFDVCPDRPPDRYFAFARIGGLVTAVNFVSCKFCLRPGPGRYNSLAGMKAVVRALRLRPKPTY